MELNVMTYNICSGRDFTADRHIDVTQAGKVMQKYMPDIIGVNEVRGLGGADPLFTEQAQTLGEQLGCRYFFGPAIEFDWGGPYGNALLTRFPILRAEVVGIPDPDVRDEDAYYETRGIIRAELDIPEVPGGVLTVLVSHFGLANSEKKNAVATVCKLLDDIHTPVLFLGDLNMEPDNEILAPVFERLHDTAAILPEKPLTFSWWEPKVKIDYIFVSSEFKTLSAESPDEHTSDHKPFCARVQI
ncbi:MAG: endonuclease/exonuclease/phosphatase family protein [Eubacteriales bacterium]|jgi:endonuclease/exonuclease/phosphatase family metal-dependent hydrolase